MNESDPRAMDQINLLPYDIVALIFGHLEFKERVICTEVCKTWRDFLLNWAGMWTEVIFRPPSQEYDTTSCVVWLKRVDSRHIRQFTFAPTSPSLCAAGLQLASLADWSRLEKLELTTNYHERVSVVDHMRICLGTWMNIIRACAPHLRELSLNTFDMCLDSRDFHHILNACPRLTRFSYWNGEQQFTHDIDESRWQLPIQNNPPGFQYLALTHFDWFTEAQFPHHRLFSLCPNLQELAIFGKNQTQASIQTLVTDIVRKTDLSLHTFRLGVVSRGSSAKHTGGTGLPGLRCLEVINWFEQDEEEGHEWLQEVAADLFHAHHETLISAAFYTEHTALVFWDRISSLPFSKTLPLTSLKYTFPSGEVHGYRIEQRLVHFLQQCRYLTTLVVQHAPWNNHQLLRILSSSDTLENVSIHSPGCRFDKYEAWDDGASYNLPPLTDLYLNTLVCDRFLDHCDSLESLTKIGFGSWTQFSSQGLQRFFASKAPNLASVHFIGCDHHYDQEVARVLAMKSSNPKVCIDTYSL